MSQTNGQPEMKLDTSQLKSSYCNVCSATSTKEEVVLTFGVNQNWDLQQNAGGPMDVQLLHRIIMSPVAAKRFHDLLTRLMTEHASRHGGI
jgi:hypothetical protein